MNPILVKRKFEERDVRRVRLALTDIDGVLRGKYVSIDKFWSAVDHGLGFCDVVFGWDSGDALYDNVQLTGWHTGYPDTPCHLDLATFRLVPWEPGTAFFLLDVADRDGKPLPVSPRQVLKRVLETAAGKGYSAFFAAEYEFFLFRETPQGLREKHFRDLNSLSPGMFGYSLLRAGQHADLLVQFQEHLSAFNVPLEGLHTETGPGVYEAAIVFSEALEAADRGVLFKAGTKEIAARFGIIPSFMAKWSAQYPGCSGHLHQSLSDGKKNLFFDAKGRHGMSKLFESYLAGQLAVAMEFAPMFWPTINSYKRLVDGFWAPVKPTWGLDNRTASFRVIPGSAKSTRLETRCPGADINPYLAVAALIAAGLHGVEKNLKLTAPPITGTNVGAENIPRAPRSLAATTEIFRRSEVARDWLGDDFVDHFAATREWEWRQWQDAVTDWELKRYFEII